MKGASLLAKTPVFFEEFGHYLKSLNYDYDEAVNSIKLTLEGDSYFMFYDRFEGEILETNEIPSEALSKGYRFAFSVECRSEVDFCTIVGSSPPNLDFLVCDSDGIIYRLNELSPDSISL